MAGRCKVSEIKKGDHVFESEYGSTFHGIALEDAQFIDTPEQKGYRCNVQQVGCDRIVEFFSDPEYPAYAPNINIVRGDAE